MESNEVGSQKAQQLKERKKDKCASHQLSKSNGNEADGSLNSKCEIILQMFSVFTSPPFTCQSGMPVCHLLHSATGMQRQLQEVF